MFFKIVFFKQEEKYIQTIVYTITLSIMIVDLFENNVKLFNIEYFTIFLKLTKIIFYSFW